MLNEFGSVLARAALIPGACAAAETKLVAGGLFPGMCDNVQRRAVISPMMAAMIGRRQVKELASLARGPVQMNRWRLSVFLRFCGQSESARQLKAETDTTFMDRKIS